MDDELLAQIEEGRLHQRIQVDEEASVRSGEVSFTVRLQDLSRGGVKLASQESVGKVGDRIVIALPTDGPPLSLDGEVVRASYTADGYTLGLQFLDSNPAEEMAKLDDVYRYLLTKGGGHRRKHPRVSRRLSVHCQTQIELKGILEDISKGGLSITVTEPMEPGIDVAVTIPDAADEPLLIMRGKVIHQREVIDQEGNVTRRAGVAFGNLTEERKCCLDSLLRLYS